MKAIFLFLLAVLFTGCNTFEPALSVTDTVSYPVKGRQGWLINQQLKFGEYETSKVKRSWTRGGNTRIDLLSGQTVPAGYPDLVSMNYNDREQSYYFQMNDFYGNSSDVYASSAFHSEDLQIGNNENSLINILEDLFGQSSYAENLFYLQLFRNREERPWQLLLDNDAAQMFADRYTGIFALDREQYYILRPINKLQTKNGPREVFGTLGFEVFNSKEESVAAVSLVDNGSVYFHTKDPDERFLMANLCAALLLQENLAE